MKKRLLLSASALFLFACDNDEVTESAAEQGVAEEETEEVTEEPETEEKEEEVVDPRDELREILEAYQSGDGYERAGREGAFIEMASHRVESFDDIDEFMLLFTNENDDLVTFEVISEVWDQREEVLGDPPSERDYIPFDGFPLDELTLDGGETEEVFIDPHEWDIEFHAGQEFRFTFIIDGDDGGTYTRYSRSYSIPISLDEEDHQIWYDRMYGDGAYERDHGDEE